jgi:hypothetical protein
MIFRIYYFGYFREKLVLQLKEFLINHVDFIVKNIETLIN